MSYNYGYISIGIWGGWVDYKELPPERAEALKNKRYKLLTTKSRLYWLNENGLVLSADRRGNLVRVHRKTARKIRKCYIMNGGTFLPR